MITREHNDDGEFYRMSCEGCIVVPLVKCSNYIDASTSRDCRELAQHYGWKEYKGVIVNDYCPLCVFQLLNVYSSTKDMLDKLGMKL